jgi:hypothetical protein
MTTTTPLTTEPTLPITDIVIKTCLHDQEYHKYCLASIDKFCTGFRNLVVVDDGDKEPYRPYLHQQVIKVEADLITDADFIMTLDSDCLFTRPVNPQTFMVDGKPIWLHTPWTPEMLAHPGTATWKRVMTEFFGVEPPSEMMRRHPFMFPRTVLQTLREYCFQKHRKSLAEYIMGSAAFSEFNVIGFHCWLHHRDLFHWIDTSVDPLPELAVNQMWSHTPVAQNLELIQSILT